MTQEPSTQESSTQEPSTQEPSTQEPSTQEPSTQEPSTQEPSTQAASPAVRTRFETGLLLHQAGRLEEAEHLYRDTLALDPAHADSLHLLGVVANQLGRRDAALALIRQAIAIAPETGLFHANLGNMLLEQRRPEEAVESLHRAIRFDAAMPAAHRDLGLALQQLNRLEEAAESFRAVLRLTPNDPIAHARLGNVLYGQRRMEDAERCYRTALALAPDYPDAHHNLGNALSAQDRQEAAAACYRAALALNPKLGAAHFQLAETLRRMERLDQAAAGYRSALILMPDDALVHHNLGAVLLRLRQWDEAIACFRAAIRLRPELAEAHNNLAMALLATGDMPAGWAEHEWRWKIEPTASARRDFPQPQWLGEPGEGRTLLIHAEQGFGDTLQFCRYAPLARARGWRVVVEAPWPLVRLLHSLDGVEAVVTAGDALPRFDLHCPMLSLPLALGTTLGTVPGATPYLHPDPAAAGAWRQRLAETAGQGPCVGLVWAGNPRSHWPAAAAIDRRRSLAPEQLAPLLQVAGIRFFSLQQGGPAAPAGFPLIDPMAGMGDFADTAALVANLDLVVSVDTAVAHLAGALGRPVCLLDRFDHCWRWLAGWRDSPWYPALRIYRQPQPGDWDPVLAELAGDLRDLAGAWQSVWAAQSGPHQAEMHRTN